MSIYVRATGAEFLLLASAVVRAAVGRAEAAPLLAYWLMLGALGKAGGRSEGGPVRPCYADGPAAMSIPSASSLVSGKSCPSGGTVSWVPSGIVSVISPGSQVRFLPGP